MRGGVVKCEESILQISPILGLNRARASGKSAKTLFRRMAYYQADPVSTETSASPAPSIGTSNGLAGTTEAAAPAPALPLTEDDGYSIVHCLPLTGRTHQIRVHLQFLGHPISNDPIYSNRRVFGPELARSDATGDNDAAIIERLSKMGKSEIADAVSYDLDRAVADMSLKVDQTQQMTVSELQNFKPLSAGTLHAGRIPAGESESSSLSHTANNYDQFVKHHDEMVADYNKRKGEKMTGEMCEICDTPLYSDPGPQELGIYLHALAYGDLLGEWNYRSQVPSWGMPPSGKEGPREIGQWDYDGTETLERLDEEEDSRSANRRGLEKNKLENVVSGGGT